VHKLSNICTSQRSDELVSCDLLYSNLHVVCQVIIYMISLVSALVKILCQKFLADQQWMMTQV